MRLFLFFLTAFLLGQTAQAQNQLSTEDKLFGLSTLWQEVNYNFAFFDQVPDLNWDKEYQLAMKEVIASETNVEYYKILQQLTAKLQDGHTQVYFPENIEQLHSTIKLKVKEQDGLYYVVNHGEDMARAISIGSIVTEINGLPIQDYINQEIAPFTAASTSHGKQMLVEDYLFFGLKDETITLAVQKNETAQKKTISLTRNYNRYGNWKLDIPSSKTNFEFSTDNTISVVSIYSFEREDVITAFERHIPAINQSNGLIIDLRQNIGGKEVVGINLAKYLVQEDYLVDLAWKSKHHVASHKAWGNSGLQLAGFENVEEFSEFGNLNAWIEFPADTLLLDPKLEKITVPVKILIGPRTASSAENFLAYLENQENITTIGSPTFGSTGQPIYFSLPGNGYARVCVKRNFLPNGKDIVGTGILPEIEIKNSVRNEINGIDKIYLQAINDF